MSERFDGKDMLAQLQKKGFRKTKGATVSERIAGETATHLKVDRRTLRRTGRDQQLAVRVTEKTKADYVAYAERHEILLAEVLERGLAVLLKEER